MNLGRVMGIGRWGLVGGVLVVGLGGLGDRPTAMWAGVALSGVALAVNTAAKFAVYGRLSIPTGRRIAVMAAWLLVASFVGGLLVDYTYSAVSPDYEGFFWALAVATAGFAAVYQGLRSKFVPEDEGAIEG